MMNPIVSVIVPTCNSEKHIEQCLQSIFQQDYRPIELIVVDNNSKDNTKKIAQCFTDKVYNKGHERSSQRNYGVKKSKGEYLLIIDSDMELQPRVVEACVNKMSENSTFRALVIPEVSFGVGFWARCKAIERSFYTGVSWLEASRFFRRNVLEEMGGYDITITGTEDFDLPQRIEEKYGKDAIGCIDQFIRHNEGNFRLLNSCKKKFYYGLWLREYKLKTANKVKFAKQSSIFRRYALYFSQPGILFHNPTLGLGVLFMKICEFFSGGAGYVYSFLLKKRMPSQMIYGPRD